MVSARHHQGNNNAYLEFQKFCGVHPVLTLCLHKLQTYLIWSSVLVGYHYSVLDGCDIRSIGNGSKY